ncbi:hypothetical protein QBC39DRAFT_379640 [Podospora conica]|nr:hypothetical protein QBC39DRAFT_379640 [Schizothecium conicum]
MLFLTFEATDLPDLWHDIWPIEYPFTEWIYDLTNGPDWENISLKDSEKDVLDKLRKLLPPAGKIDRRTLYLIYYRGRASHKAGKDLVFRSHTWEGNLWDEIESKIWNDTKPWPDDMYPETIPEKFKEQLSQFEPSEGVHWNKIRPAIMRAKCDTLVLLDCFDDKIQPPLPNAAGILAPEEHAYDTRFRKHVIGGCEGETLRFMAEHDWDYPIGRYSMSVCEILHQINTGNPRTTVRQGEKVLRQYSSPLFHIVLSKNNMGEMLIPRLACYEEDRDDEDDEDEDHEDHEDHEDDEDDEDGEGEEDEDEKDDEDNKEDEDDEGGEDEDNEKSDDGEDENNNDISEDNKNDADNRDDEELSDGTVVPDSPGFEDWRKTPNSGTSVDIILPDAPNMEGRRRPRPGW